MALVQPAFDCHEAGLIDFTFERRSSRCLVFFYLKGKSLFNDFSLILLIVSKHNFETPENVLITI